MSRKRLCTQSDYLVPDMPCRDEPTCLINLSRLFELEVNKLQTVRIVPKYVIVFDSPLVEYCDQGCGSGSGSGRSGRPFSLEAEAEARKFYRFRFHIGYLT